MRIQFTAQNQCIYSKKYRFLVRPLTRNKKYFLSAILNKGNSSILQFESHKILRENKSGLQTQTEGNTSAIRGKQRNNRNTEVQQKTKRPCNTHRNEL